MKLSTLIKKLGAAIEEYGDIDTVIINEESGDYCSVLSVSKLHAFTGPYGCMNRDDKVNKIEISRHALHQSDDLLI